MICGLFAQAGVWALVRQFKRVIALVIIAIPAFLFSAISARAFVGLLLGQFIGLALVTAVEFGLRGVGRSGFTGETEPRGALVRDGDGPFLVWMREPPPEGRLAVAPTYVVVVCALAYFSLTVVRS